MPTLRPAWITILGLWLSSLSPTVWGATLSVVDGSERKLADVMTLPRGNEQLVAFDFVAYTAGWKAVTEEGLHRYALPSDSVALRSAVAFARAGQEIIQLRLPPEEWDGALWLCLSDLALLTKGRAEFDEVAGSIRVQILPDTSQSAIPSPGTPNATPFMWQLRTVIIDPGHGGKDPGATGLDRLREKEVVLDVAERLAARLREHGLNVELTRQGDEFVKLRDRVRFANAKRGDLFLSIHCNSYRDTSISGVETYFLSPARSSRGVEVALFENRVSEFEDNNGNYQDLTEENFILLSMATSQFLKDSERWAALTARETAKATGLNWRGVDQGGFYVLMGPVMPAILLECGYLSSPRDASVLGSPEGRQRVAEAAAKSILTMKATLEREASSR